MADETSYGWAGKILRVNLSTGSVTTQPTDPYKEYIGGMGLANKIMFDEVPAGTDPFSPENKIVFAVGPLTASGVPLAGRTTSARCPHSRRTTSSSTPTAAACWARR